MLQELEVDTVARFLKVPKHRAQGAGNGQKPAASPAKPAPSSEMTYEPNVAEKPAETSDEQKI